MKTTICLCIFIISLRYVLLSDVIIAETTMANEISDLVQEKQICRCKKFDCTCCEYLNWKFINIDGLICANVKYVTDNVGVILSLSYNNTIIVEQHIFLNSLFPICIKDNVVGILPGSLCIYAYDISATSEHLHVCFKIVGRMSNINFATINLGCINIKKNNVNKRNLYEMFMNWYMCKIHKNECSIIS